MIRHSKTYVAAPPGFTVQEMIDERAISEAQLAQLIGESEAFVRDLIEGDVELTSDVADKLETALGMNASFWLKLEYIYRETLIKVAKENASLQGKNVAAGFAV